MQEIGKLQSSDIPAAFADLALQVTNDFLEIGLVKARLEELIPEPLPVKAQAHALAGQAAIQRVSLLDTLDHEL